MQLNTKKQLKEKNGSNIIPCMTKSAWISTGILARSDRRQSMKPHDLVQLWKPFWCFLAYPSMARAILPYFSDFTRCPQRSTRFVICWLFLPSFLPSRLDMLGTCNSSLNFEQVLLPSQKMGDMNWLAESRDMCVCVCPCTWPMVCLSFSHQWLQCSVTDFPGVRWVPWAYHAESIERSWVVRGRWNSMSQHVIKRCSGSLSTWPGQSWKS